MRTVPVLLSLALLAGVAACADDPIDDLFTPAPTGCFIGEGAEQVHLTAEQTYHAATIAAVGQRDGMDERAVAVAVATAMQESELVNVDYGDHDSLGLFQQRPSSGWGTEEEILDPVYASFKFYEKLRRIDGWQEMEIGDAAQAVQVSAYPDAYAQWESDALAIAAVFAGGAEAGMTCIASNGEDSVDAQALAEAHAHQWGTDATVEDLTIAIETDGDSGWNRAAWAVAKSYEFGIASVEFGGMRWEPGEEGWAAPDSEAAEVTESATSDSTVFITLIAPE
ncbi:hypothetical protein [Glycomyces buryatensis]|uniref:Heavy metal transporter n=1 Tax=Glycomyces buryatensis TaxID=2570927 RepID=A0A4S8QID8_9ACTN|nr:hypothetical protein [Glycomyces buryatensis]THV41149.1 hypothetical protein FAB82_12920 [Glycomyces buryatensis]